MSPLHGDATLIVLIKHTVVHDYGGSGPPTTVAEESAATSIADDDERTHVFECSRCHEAKKGTRFAMLWIYECEPIYNLPKSRKLR